MRYRITLLTILLVLLAGCERRNPVAPIVPTGSIDVRSTPPDASVFLDGKAMNVQTPTLLKDVSLGTHIVRVEKNTYLPAADTVEVSKDSTSTVQLTLVSAPASLAVTSSPAGAAIFLNGQDTGKQTPAQFDPYPVGVFTVRLQLRGYLPVERTDSLVGGDQKTVSLALIQAPPYTLALSKSGTTLYLMGLDDLQPRTIATDAGGGWTRWSPDGQYLAYPTASGVTVLNRDGSAKATVGPPTNPASTWDFSWSNDGTKLINGHYCDGIYQYLTDDNSYKLLFATYYRLTYDHGPAFSPADTAITFVHHEYETWTFIRVMRADGTRVRDVSPGFYCGSRDENINLCWVSPTLVAFATRITNMFGDTRQTGIFTLNVNTGVITNVVSANGAWVLRLSPDRQRFLYATSEGIFLGSTTTWTVIKVAPFNVWDMSWSPDNNSAAAVSPTDVYWLDLRGKWYRLLPTAPTFYGVSVTRQ